MKGGLYLYTPKHKNTAVIRNLNPVGFTIVETMIVLVVTGILFLSAVTIVSGKQGKTQFQQGINAVKTEIEQTVNDVQSGYYSNTKNFTCSVGAGGTLAISVATPAAATEQGANKDCIFMGKAIQFKIQNEDNYAVYPVAGARSATSLSTSKAKAVGQSVEKKLLQFGLTPKWVRPASGTDVGAVGFVTTFGLVDGQVRGSQSIQVVPVSSSSLTQSMAAGQAAIDAGLATATPSSKVRVCYQSGTTDQHGIISISGSGAVSLTIDNGDCP